MHPSTLVLSLIYIQTQATDIEVEQKDTHRKTREDIEKLKCYQTFENKYEHPIIYLLPQQSQLLANLNWSVLLRKE